MPPKPFWTAGKIILILLVLLLISSAGGFYFYRKASSDPQKEATKDLTDTIAAVSRHMVLPGDETPTLATVSDPEKLKDQKFFINAKKGDKVLVFSISKKAILYSPNQDKIIEVAPVNVTGE